MYLSPPSARPHFCSVTGSVTHSYLVPLTYHPPHIYASAPGDKTKEDPRRNPLVESSNRTLGCLDRLLLGRFEELIVAAGHKSEMSQDIVTIAQVRHRLLVT